MIPKTTFHPPYQVTPPSITRYRLYVMIDSLSVHQLKEYLSHNLIDKYAVLACNVSSQEEATKGVEKSYLKVTKIICVFGLVTLRNGKKQHIFAIMLLFLSALQR